MANSFFQFKQFIIHQDKCGMKVTTDGCLFGAWVAKIINGEKAIINNCLDIGTGTGLLSLMLAQKKETITIDAIEIDIPAARQAKENIAASPWAHRVKVIPGDVKNFIFAKKYDFIICNPPFYQNELTSPDPQRNKAHHQDGLLLIELLTIIKKQLLPGGKFFLLFPYKRNEEIKQLLFESGLHLQQLMLVKQTVNHDYFRVMIEGTLQTGKNKEISIEEMAIKDDEGNYTPAFISLLRDYYLHC